MIELRPRLSANLAKPVRDLSINFTNKHQSSIGGRGRRAMFALLVSPFVARVSWMFCAVFSKAQVFANYSVTSWGYYPSWVIGSVMGLDYSLPLPLLAPWQCRWPVLVGVSKLRCLGHSWINPKHLKKATWNELNQPTGSYQERTAWKTYSFWRLGFSDQSPINPRSHAWCFGD